MSSLSSTTYVGEKRKSDDLDTAETSKIDKRLKTEEKHPVVNPPTTKGLLSIKLNSIKKDDKVNVTKTKTNSAVEPLVKIDRKLRAVFDADDSGEEFCEQMPLEAKMKMRNIGRDTPTSSGPNSFSKGKHGFIDIRKMHEKQFDD